jgi:NAD(P)H-quinone oxidoreductase subunit 4
MASAGIPGLVGFVTEFLVFQGSYAVYPVQTLLCVIGTGLTAVYFVILLNRTCFGRLDNDIAYFPKVNFAERFPAFVLAALILFFGIQPNWLVKWSERTAAGLIAAVPPIVTPGLAASWSGNDFRAMLQGPQAPTVDLALSSGPAIARSR